MKPTHLFLWTLILITLFSSLTLADTGCFFYDKSPLYCQTVDESTAREECSFFSNCILPVVFFPGKSCEDKTVFPHCEKILCKGICSEEWRGQCLQGKITPEEQPFWCSSGCCQFNSENGNKCSYEPSAGSCESAARNADATQFKFNSAILESECASSCSTGVGGSGGVSKVVTPLEILPMPFGAGVSDFSFVPKNTTEELKTSSTHSLLIWLGAIIFLAGLMGGTAYYIHTKRKRPVEKKNEAKAELSNPLSPFQSNPAVKEHIETLHHHLDHKKKEKEREQVLTVFTGLEVPFSESSVDKLEKVVKHHKPVAFPLPEPKSESAMSKLKHFVNKK